jgi:hypothetical protein
LLPIHSGDAEIRSHLILPDILATPLTCVAEKSRMCKRFGAAPLQPDLMS